MLEWLLLYFLLGGIAFAIEHKTTGGTHAQDREFYAVSACLFVIFALPGFIYHVELKPRLVRRRGNLA